MDRIVAFHTKIPLENIKNASLTEDQWCEVSKAASELSTSSIKIYDKIFTLNGIGAECRKLKIEESLDVVIIDYLQLIEKGESRLGRKLKTKEKTDTREILKSFLYLELEYICIQNVEILT